MRPKTPNPLPLIELNSPRYIAVNPNPNFDVILSKNYTIKQPEHEQNRELCVVNLLL